MLQKMEQQVHNQDGHKGHPHQHQQPIEATAPVPETNQAGSQPIPSNQAEQLKNKMMKLKRYWHILDQKQNLRNKEEWQSIQKQLRQVLKESIKDDSLNRALGAIFGATIGDALGAYCQFNHHLSDKVVDEAMEMQGGGTFGLAAGQFTDDSELATHLLTGLSTLDPELQLAEQEQQIISNIGIQYVQWMNDGPFDIGNTTRCGIITLEEYHQDLKGVAQKKSKETTFMEQMFNSIYDCNKNSKANGSLMRISPMALFFALTGEDPLSHSQFIRDQIRLTHPNKTLAKAGVCWVNILSQLITRKDNKEETFQKIIKDNEENNEFSELKEWFEEASKDREAAMPATPQMGFAKIGFTYGLRVLHYLAKGKENKFHQNLYRNWMWWIIKQAGDTDTNGAIAGGLMGSVLGFWDLPQKYVARSLKTITDGVSFPIEDSQQAPKEIKKRKYYTPHRPVFYEPSNVLVSTLQLITKCRAYKQKFGMEK